LFVYHVIGLLLVDLSGSKQTMFMNMFVYRTLWLQHSQKIDKLIESLAESQRFMTQPQCGQRTSTWYSRDVRENPQRILRFSTVLERGIDASSRKLKGKCCNPYTPRHSRIAEPRCRSMACFAIGERVEMCPADKACFSLATVP
jgi:hypothetical protein